MKSRRQQREAVVAKKRAKDKLRKSHLFGKLKPMSREQMEEQMAKQVQEKFMTGEAQ